MQIPIETYYENRAVTPALAALELRQIARIFIDGSTVFKLHIHSPKTLDSVLEYLSKQAYWCSFSVVYSSKHQYFEVCVDSNNELINV